MARMAGFKENNRHGGESLRAFSKPSLLIMLFVFAALWTLGGCAGRANYLAGGESSTTSSGGSSVYSQSSLDGATPGAVAVLLPSNYSFTSSTAPAGFDSASMSMKRSSSVKSSMRISPEYAVNYFNASVEISVWPSDISISASGTKLMLKGVGSRTATVLVPGWMKIIVTGSASEQTGVKVTSIDTYTQKAALEVYVPANSSGTTFSRRAYQCQVSSLTSLISGESIKIRDEYGILVDTITPETASDTIEEVSSTSISFADVPSDVYQQYMTQETSSDTESPRITLITPPDGSTLEAGTNEVTVKFSENMDLTVAPSVNLGSNSIVMTSYSGVTWQGYLYVPTDGSLDSTSETLIVSGAKDLAGNMMIASSSYKWIIAARDIVKPTVASISPVSGSVLTAGDKTITVTFSELMNISWPLSVKVGSHQLSQTYYLGNTWKGELTIPGDGSWDDTGEIVSIWGGRDLAGNVMDVNYNAGTYEIAANYDDTTPPTVVSVDPVSGSAIPFGTTEISIVFSETMNVSVAPLVNLGTLELSQKSYSGMEWVGEVNVPSGHSATSEILYITGAQDMAENEMVPDASVSYLIQVGG